MTGRHVERSADRVDLALTLRRERDRLLAERERLERREHAGCDLDLADAATTGRIEHAARSRLGKLEIRLATVETALERLDEGGYGTCEICDQPILSERLAVLPMTQRCREHATTGR